MLTAIPDQAVGYGSCKCRALPVLPKLRIPELRLKHLIKAT